MQERTGRPRGFIRGSKAVNVESDMAGRLSHYAK